MLNETLEDICREFYARENKKKQRADLKDVLYDFYIDATHDIESEMEDLGYELPDDIYEIETAADDMAERIKASYETYKKRIEEGEYDET